MEAPYSSRHMYWTLQKKICNKVAMINHGKLVFSGTMADMLKEKEGSSLEEIFIDILDQN